MLGGGGGRNGSRGRAVHVAFVVPYTARSGVSAIAPPHALAWDVEDSGTLVVIGGPRFSTRAESRWYTAQGWTLVGMTGQPEAVLARELALCYTSLSLVTDTDAGVTEGEGVTQEEVLRAFGENVTRLRASCCRSSFPDSCQAACPLVACPRPEQAVRPGPDSSADRATAS